MQIKTYTAASMKDILSQIKSELGSDAVILSKREITDAGFGLTAKPLIEVTAAVDYDTASEARPGARPAAVQAYQKTAEAFGSPMDSLSGDIIEIKEMMKALIAQSGLNDQNPLKAKLAAKGLRQNLVDVILTKLGGNATWEGVRGLMGKIVKTDLPGKSRVWTFVGSTGVGKTTTIAKIAAQSVLNEHKKVALVTLDTYRIGAVDQGRIYAKILNIPFVSVTTPAEFKTALVKLDSMDLVLVDTVGRSPLLREYVPQLKEYFDGTRACTFLLMPVATRDAEMDITTKAFAGLNIDRMIFTKADEAGSLGSVITHNLIHRIPISYLTTGQRVPEDIEVATAAHIIERCLGDMA
jgi:flagellar biosynthesis protein FlhF